jgi:hypothetical protein
MEIRYADGILDDGLGEFIGLTVGATMLEAAAGEDHREGRALVAASALGVELRRTAELGGDDDEGLVQHAGALEVFDQAGEGVVELADEDVLVVDAVVMHVPAGAVDEVEVVRDFDEAHAALDEATGEQAALAEFAAVGLARVGGFLLQVEVAHERRPGEAEGLLLGLGVFGQR